MAIIEHMKNSDFKGVSHGLAALALIAGTPAALADSVIWIAGNGAWENATNWSGGQAPGAEDFAVLGKALSPTITSTAADNIALELRNSDNINVTAGKLTVLGTIQTIAMGTFSVLNGAKVDAGRVSHEAGNGAAFLVDGTGSAVSVVQGVFNSGKMVIASDATLDAESIDNFAVLAVESGAQVTANSMITWAFGSPFSHSGSATSVTGAGSALTIHGALTNQDQVLVSDGGLLETDSIDVTADGALTPAGLAATSGGRITTQSVINHGFVQVHSGGSPATEGARLEVSNLFTNHGTMQVMAGTTANIAALDNRASATIEGGSLSGQEFANSEDGSLTLTNGATVTFDDAISASRFGISIDGVQATLKTVKFQQLSGTTFINGGTLGASGEFGVQFAGGELTGHGIIAGKLTMSVAGVLIPGDTLDATQRFDVTAGLDLLGGTFAVDLGGTSSGDYDLLDVAGVATLGGILKISLLDGFDPVLGDAFDIILADSISGAFGTVLLPTLGDGLEFTTFNGGSFFRLQVAAVPLPAPALLLGGALAVLCWAARRRQRV